MSLSLINDKISKNFEKLRDTNTFFNSIYSNIEMLNKNYDDMKSFKENLQELEELVQNNKNKYSKEINVLNNC